MKKESTYEPMQVFTPGEIALNKLEDIGITQAEFADRMDMSAKHINEFVNGKIKIETNMAVSLSRVIGGSPEFWLQIQNYYSVRKSFLDEHLELQSDLLKMVPVKELIARNYIQPYTDTADGVDKLLRFFGMSSVTVLNRMFSAPPAMRLRKSQKVKCDQYSLMTWLRMGEIEAENVDCEPYNKEKFVETLKTIRSKTREWNDQNLKDLQMLCAECGVAVVFVKGIAKTAVNGATKWINSKKAMINLSCRHKRNDIFWFSFFHEAGHVLNDRKTVRQDIDAQVKKEEASADKFASEFLIPHKYEKDLMLMKSTESIEDFARKLDIHPAIVVGRIHHINPGKNNQFNKLIQNFQFQ